MRYSAPMPLRPSSLAALLVLAACRPDAAPTAPPPAAVSAAPTVSAAAPAASASVHRDEAMGAACGPLDCRLFDSAGEAFAVVLAQKPLVLAVGEAHAQKGSEAPSTTKRFTDELLPQLQGRASDLLVELMLPPKGCKAEEQKVRTEQKQVTEKQAETNQNEYVTLGESARKLGVVPDALRPSCADLDAIAKAGNDSIPQMLGTIERLTEAKTKELLSRNAAAKSEKMVVTYGGALHNDVAPLAGREAWSYGPALIAATGGKYIELDVFAPEAIQDTESWRKLEWYPHYDKGAHAGKAVLFRPKPGAYVLILPRASAPR